MRASLLHIFAAVASSCLALACNGSVDVTPGDAGGPPLACTPGAQQPCSCPLHGDGAATCNAEGSGFGACMGCDTPWSASISADDGDVGTTFWGLAVLPGGGVVVPYQVFGANDSVETRFRKYDAQGTVGWDVPAVAWMKAATNGAGPVMVAGQLSQGSTSLLGQTLTCAADHCTVLGQLDDAGAFAWARSYESAPPANNIAVASDGHFVVAGGGAVTAFSPSGDQIWTRAVSTSAPSCPVTIDALAVSPAGEVAVGGSTCSAAATIDFGSGTIPGPASDQPGPTNFFAKLDANGDLVFGRLASPGDFGHTRVALTSAGELVASLGVDGVIDLGSGPLGTPGGSQRIVAKLSPAGDLLWSRALASSMKPLGASWVTVDAADHVWIATAAVPGMTFQGAPIVSADESDALLLEYATSGDEVKKWQFGAGKLEGITATAVADNGDPVIAGQLDDSIDLGQGPLVNTGTRDIFVAKLVP